MITLGDIRGMIRGALSWVVTYSTISRSTADGMGDEIDGRSAPDEPDYQTPARRMWPFGIRSRPPAGTEAVVVHAHGSAIDGIMVGAESAKYGPSDLADGETALYSKVNAKAVHADASGNTKITSAAPSGGSQGDVTVNGGTLPVARKTDPISVTGGSYTAASLTLHVVDGLGVAGTLAITVAGGVLVVTPAGIVTPAGTFTMSGTISDGAQHFKG